MRYAACLAPTSPVDFTCGHCRDPRATKNAIYYPDAVRVLLRIAKNHNVPLLFVTNNACNKLMRFEDAEDVNKQLELQGLLKRISDVWFSMPHLKGVWRLIYCATGRASNWVSG